MSRLLFVYGSLRAGQPASSILAGCRRQGSARTTPTHRLLDLGAYPALLPDGATSVMGEVVQLPDGTARDLVLAALDRYEGAMYRRELVTLADGRQAMAYVWRGPDVADAKEVATGDWLHGARCARESG